MELLQLRYFQTIARYESVTLAAKYYNIPQSSMSQTLARLENELGVKLFDRKNKKIFLNETGAVFLNNIEKSLLLIDNGIELIKDKTENLTGKFNIQLLQNNRFVIIATSEFTAMHPNVNFDISHDWYSENDWQYDLRIASSPTYKKMTNSIPFIKENLMLAVCDEHPLSKRKSVNISELKNEKFITTSPHSELYRLTADTCENFGFKPHIVLSCDDSYYIRKFVSENRGIAFVPPLSWEGLFRKNTKLIEVKPQISTTSYILWNEERYHGQAFYEFIKFLKQKAENLEGNIINQNKR